MADPALPQPLQVGRLGVVGAVDDAQVLAAADLEARLGKALAPPGQVGGRLHHHALAAVAGQPLPPAGRVRHGDRVGGVDVQPASRPERLRVGGDEAVGHVEVPGVRLGLVRGALGGEQLERGHPDSVKAVGLPLVAAVGGGEGIRVDRP